MTGAGRTGTLTAFLCLHVPFSACVYLSSPGFIFMLAVLGLSRNDH